MPGRPCSRTTWSSPPLRATAAAVALLAEAAAQVGGRAPQTAVHWLTVARTLVQGPTAQEVPLLGPLAGALAGAGRFDDAPPRPARAARDAAGGLARRAPS